MYVLEPMTSHLYLQFQSNNAEFILFFSFTLIVASFSRSAKPDCSILEHTKNDFRIANLRFCRKRGLLTRVQHLLRVIMFLAWEHVVILLHSKLLGFASPHLLQCDYIIYMKCNFFLILCLIDHSCRRDYCTGGQEGSPGRLPGGGGIEAGDVSNIPKWEHGLSNCMILLMTTSSSQGR